MPPVRFPRSHRSRGRAANVSWCTHRFEGDPRGLLLFALEKLTGKKSADVVKAKPPLPPTPRLTLPRKPDAKKVGRNDPCPCGSGKKFKNCCMKQQSGF